MNRKRMAEETVQICDAGHYVTPDGHRVAIGDFLANAKEGTVVYSARNPPSAERFLRSRPAAVEVTGESTYQALDRLAKEGGHLACLNFASARNPGGGFLGGAQAQEEALARASGLYPCLLQGQSYYQENRANRSTLYLDMAIFSPGVPFFRNDAGVLQESAILASVITAPAPNAGAITANEPHNLPLVGPTLKRRGQLVLEVAAAHKVDILILGAWGCGVFRNDPRMVADAFAALLGSGCAFAEAFDKVVFAVYDTSTSQANHRAFVEVFCQ